MTDTFDPRPGWVRRRTHELQTTGLSYAVAREQAETEAEEKFGAGENGDNGNGNGATG
jgi:hypothetical protein